MRILWVKVGGLCPVDRGGRRRSFETIRALSRRHRVTLIGTHSSAEERVGLRESLPCEAAVSFEHHAPKNGTARFAGALARSWLSPLPLDLLRWRVPALCREVARHVRAGEADLVVADFLAAAPNVPTDAAVPVVLFAHNVEHRIWQRLAAVEERPLRRALLGIEARKMQRVETRVVSSVRRTVAVSEADREVLADASPGADVRAIPTGVDLDYFRPEPAIERPGSIVFVGAMDWYPNEDAVAHFAASILPIVRREVPEAVLQVVGRNPPDRLRALGAHVRPTGTVEDVRPWLAAASVVVVPLRIGGGTRLKIFEALAMGKAVVSTTVGAEGLPLGDAHCILADDPADFARHVVALLRDPGRRAALGAAGRRLVESRFGWDAVGQEFEDRISGLERAPTREFSATQPQDRADGDVQSEAARSEA